MYLTGRHNNVAEIEKEMTPSLGKAITSVQVSTQLCCGGAISRLGFLSRANGSFLFPELSCGRRSQAAVQHLGTFAPQG